MPALVEETPVPMDEVTKFCYLKWNDLYKTETAFQTSIPAASDAPDQRRQNVETQQGDEELIRDVRGCVEQPMLDTHGFQYFQHKTALNKQQLYDPEAIHNLYLPEFATFLQENIESADHIVVFDWRLRDSGMESGTGREINYDDKLKRVAPAPLVHIGKYNSPNRHYTDAGTLRRIERHLGKDCWRLLRGRLRIINMWRPLNGPIRDCSLAFCDGRTYDPHAIIPMDTIRPSFVSQAGAAQYRKGMKWYYRSGQKNDEPVVFKSFDSDQSVTSFTPHAPFKHACIPKNVQPRESIEIRALVFTCPDGDKSVRYDVKEDD